MARLEPVAEPTDFPEEGLFLEEAAAIGERLLEKRVFAKDGSFIWVGPGGYGTEHFPFRIGRLGPYLYNGTPGVVLFLAALERVLGGGRYGEAALQALAPLRRQSAALAADPERGSRFQMPIGGLIGTGSMIYSLLRIGEWLGQPDLAQEAHDLTVLITPERIALDGQVRIQTGSAGAILALLALHSRHPEPNRDGRTPLAIATECAAHLLSQRTSYEGRPRAWQLSPGKPPLMGFAYGAAGIAYTLLQLHRMNPDPEVRAAAAEGFDFVSSFYSPEQGSWRDPRADFEARHQGPGASTWADWWASRDERTTEQIASQSDPPSEGRPASTQPIRPLFPTSWCHGSAGIALGFLAARDLLDRSEVSEEVTGALESLRRRVESSSFIEETTNDLCCGHMGIAEVLLESSRRLQDRTLLTSARFLGLRVVLQARNGGGYKVRAARGTGEYSPSLFQGESGIGYTLLRLARPEAIPCLLLMG
jgi:lantibiotic modifying enzyme